MFDVSTGIHVSKFLASVGEVLDHLGVSIDIDNGIVLAGADGDDAQYDLIDIDRFLKSASTSCP